MGSGASKKKELDEFEIFKQHEMRRREIDIIINGHKSDQEMLHNEHMTMIKNHNQNVILTDDVVTNMKKKRLCDQLSSATRNLADRIDIEKFKQKELHELRNTIERYYGTSEKIKQQYDEYMMKLQEYNNLQNSNNNIVKNIIDLRDNVIERYRNNGVLDLTKHTCFPFMRVTTEKY
jgi:hypothetical protein